MGSIPGERKRPLSSNVPDTTCTGYKLRRVLDEDEVPVCLRAGLTAFVASGDPNGGLRRAPVGDRKSTRLNSSHLVISYAVFCLKKKKYTHIVSHMTPL